MQVFRTFIQWLVHESNSEWDYHSIVYVGKQNTLPLSLVRLALCNRWAHNYLSHFYMSSYKIEKRKQRRYQRITAWYDALNELDYSNFKEEYMYPMEVLMQTESDITVREDCERCAYMAQMERFELHNMCCYDDHPCYNCQEVDDCLECLDLGVWNCMYHFDFFERPKQVFGTCTCVLVRTTSDYMFEQELIRYVPTLIDQGWHMIWTYEGRNKIPRLELIAPDEGLDNVLSYSQELSLDYYGE